MAAYYQVSSQYTRPRLSPETEQQGQVAYQPHLLLLSVIIDYRSSTNITLSEHDTGVGTCNHEATHLTPKAPHFLLPSVNTLQSASN
jgi:hypothetical protein